MGRVELFDHTADVGLRVWGEDLADLLRTAAEAVFDYVVANRDEVRPLESEEVRLSAEGPEDLLADWISELIFRVETAHRIYGRFSVDASDDGRSLVARIEGEPIDVARHRLDHEVKAVTRHGLELRREPEGGWYAEMILDI